MQLQCQLSAEKLAIINPTVLNMSDCARTSRIARDHRLAMAEFHQEWWISARDGPFLGQISAGSRSCRVTAGRFITRTGTQSCNFCSVLVLVCAAALSVSAQSGTFSPNQGESDGVSAGGKWMEFHSEDKMTGAKKVRIELLSDNYLSEDPDYKPRIEFICTNGKYTEADFNPGIRLGPPNRPGFWGQPQMEVM